MNITSLLPFLLVPVLAGCATTGDATANDPVRTRVLAELAQARADGLFPLSEAQYLYPWPVAASHPADAAAAGKRATAPHSGG